MPSSSFEDRRQPDPAPPAAPAAPAASALDIAVDLADDRAVVGSAPSLAVVRVRGDLDLATSPALLSSLEALVRDGRHDLELDLGGVEFCDVTGLNVLLRTHGVVRERGGSLSVRGQCPPLRRMLAVLHLTDELELEPRNDARSMDGVSGGY